MENPFNFSPFRSPCVMCMYAIRIQTGCRRCHRHRRRTMYVNIQSVGWRWVCANNTKRAYTRNMNSQKRTEKKKEKEKRKSEKRVKNTNDNRLVLCTEKRTLFKLLTVNHDRRDLNLNWRCKTKDYAYALLLLSPWNQRKSKVDSLAHTHTAKRIFVDSLSFNGGGGGSSSNSSSNIWHSDEFNFDHSFVNKSLIFIVKLYSSIALIHDAENHVVHENEAKKKI